MSTEAPYAELSVNECRIVVLHPGLEGDPIQCHLEKFSLDAPPQYEALSYAWGGERGEHPTPFEPSGDLEDLPELEGEYAGGSGRSQSQSRKQAGVRPASVPQGKRERWEAEFRVDKRLNSLHRSPSRPWDYFPGDGPPERLLQLPIAKITPKEPGGSDSTGCQVIALENHEFPVRENLGLALQHLRREDHNRNLWIDAICIDQDNREERGHQVARMSKIYQCANTVCIWLGPSEDDSDEAMEFIRRLWHIKQSIDGTDDNADCAWEGFKREFMTHGYPRTEQLSQLRALSFLVDRRWFYRRWVAQEVAFAAEVLVQCGNSVAKWPEFTFAISFLHSHHDKLTRILHQYYMWAPWFTQPGKCGRPGDIQAKAAARFLFVTKDILRKNETNHITSHLVDAETLMTSLSDLQVSDPRDTVYSLFSLASDAKCSAYLTPNYKKSTVEVCVDFVNHVILHKRSLDILCHRWAPRTLGLPSWIKSRSLTLSDTSFPGPLQAGSFVGERSGSWYRASNRKPARAKISFPNGGAPRLRVKGCVAGLITITKEVAYGGRVPVSWISILKDISSSGPKSGGFREFWNVLVGGRTPSGGQPPATYESICWLLFERGLTQPGFYQPGFYLPHLIDTRAFIRVYQGASGTRSPIPKPFLSKMSQFPEAFAFFQRLCACTWDRQLVATSDARMGLVPSRAKIGDLVCVLLGCNVPVILRRVGEKYVFIGEAYFHSIMEGEALEEVEAGKYPFQDFILM